MAKTYNGHRNYNYWNVALWISNDEGLYRFALELKRKLGARKAAEIFVSDMVEFSKHRDKLGRPTTPDGAPYTISSVTRAMQWL